MTAHEQKIMDALPSRVRKIVAEAAKEHGVRIYSIFSPSRRAPVVMARWAAMYRVKAGNPSLSAPQVAKWFGRDHTSVLSAWARYAAITGAPSLTDYNLSSRVENPSAFKGAQL